jgi:hypothetical protein
MITCDAIRAVLVAVMAWPGMTPGVLVALLPATAMFTPLTPRPDPPLPDMATASDPTRPSTDTLPPSTHMAKEATMRGRVVLFIVLAVATAFAAGYLGVSAGAPKAAGKPPTATTTSSPAGSTRNRTPGPGPVRSHAASSQQTGQKMGSPKSAPPTAPTPPKACSSTAAAQPSAVTILADPPSSSATGPVHFGQVSATSVDDSAQISMSDDYQALTTGFSKFEIATGQKMGKGSGECDVTRSLSMTLPVTGAAQAGKLGFYVQGYAFAGPGASTQLTLRGNGQVKIQRFPAGSDESYILALEFPVTPGATYTLSVQLEIHQNPGTGGDAYLNMASIDSQLT